MARFGLRQATVVPPQATAATLANLPLEALRLPPDTANGLRLLGFETIGRLATTPRAPLVRRFGPLLATRLDQAHGSLFEPIVPAVPADLPQARQTFVEPLLTAEAFCTVIAHLVATVCADLEKAGLGARRLDLLFERVDGSVQALRIGTARPSRAPRHLARMLDERVERVDPGLGVEAMRLVVPQTDALAYTQAAARLAETDGGEQDLGPLVDRLGNRLGADRIYRIAPVESDVPERSVRRVPPLAPSGAPRGTPSEKPPEAPLVTPPGKPPGASPGTPPGKPLTTSPRPPLGTPPGKPPEAPPGTPLTTPPRPPLGTLPGKPPETPLGTPPGMPPEASPGTSLGTLRGTLLKPPSGPSFGPPLGAPRMRTSWPADLPRPVRLLDPPQPIEAMALLPDQPPVAFTWRRVRHRVRRADGPERIAGEWWKRDGELRSLRDYFRVEDEDGHRFWLFRRGDGDDPLTGDRRWFLHGFF
jgi:protein ImuB